MSNRGTEKIMKLQYLLTAFLIWILSSNIYAAPRILDQIKKMDSDRDGSITLEEFNSNSLNRFQLMDTNSDGNISEEEFLAPISARFERMDLNSDGVIQRKELKKALKQSRKNKKQGKVKEKKKPKPFIKQ